MRDIPLKEIMVTRVFTAFVGDPLSLVEKKFRDHGIRHMPVVDEQKRLVGMFTQRDLARCIAPHKTEDGYVFDKEQLDRFILKHVMSQDPVALRPDDKLESLVDLMARNKYGCVPIVGADRVLVGIVTQIDVLKCLARWLREEKK